MPFTFGSSGSALSAASERGRNYNPNAYRGVMPAPRPPQAPGLTARPSAYGFNATMGAARPDRDRFAGTLTGVPRHFGAPVPPVPSAVPQWQQPQMPQQPAFPQAPGQMPQFPPGLANMTQLPPGLQGNMNAAVNNVATGPTSAVNTTQTTRTSGPVPLPPPAQRGLNLASFGLPPAASRNPRPLALGPNQPPPPVTRRNLWT